MSRLGRLEIKTQSLMHATGGYKARSWRVVAPVRSPRSAAYKGANRVLFVQ